jgi:hypothetical protein
VKIAPARYDAFATPQLTEMAEGFPENENLVSMHRKIAFLLLIFTLFNSAILAASALIDICCDLTDRGIPAYQLVDGSNQDSKPHIPHCCHASVHFSALTQANGGNIESPRQTDWPLTFVTHKAFLADAPPVPPPNV